MPLAVDSLASPLGTHAELKKGLQEAQKLLWVVLLRSNKIDFIHTY